ncbi:hypothetical protein C9374_011057 [Naegleria lovaniensis]|uniref:Protein kinase domain-containing protein n=1 Tax=Naegleria lovaniensis TaxID=51637 RepID=A0AA88GA72_NAELO|nr:uncharacterized protein C9374_011057 [Naegleria lovaniensis]KAG2374220.1 hypothetical protein C9374_011057 [Naegleria lovaniensis]
MKVRAVWLLLTVAFVVKGLVRPSEGLLSNVSNEGVHHASDALPDVLLPSSFFNSSSSTLRNHLNIDLVLRHYRTLPLFRDGVSEEEYYQSAAYGGTSPRVRYSLWVVESSTNSNETCIGVFCPSVAAAFKYVASRVAILITQPIPEKVEVVIDITLNHSSTSACQFQLYNDSRLFYYVNLKSALLSSTMEVSCQNQRQPFFEGSLRTDILQFMAQGITFTNMTFVVNNSPLIGFFNCTLVNVKCFTLGNVDNFPPDQRHVFVLGDTYLLDSSISLRKYSYGEVRNVRKANTFQHLGDGIQITSVEVVNVYNLTTSDRFFTEDASYVIIANSLFIPRSSIYCRGTRNFILVSSRFIGTFNLPGFPIVSIYNAEHIEVYMVEVQVDSSWFQAISCSTLILRYLKVNHCLRDVVYIYSAVQASVEMSSFHNVKGTVLTFDQAVGYQVENCNFSYTTSKKSVIFITENPLSNIFDTDIPRNMIVNSTFFHNKGAVSSGIFISGIGRVFVTNCTFDESVGDSGGSIVYQSSAEENIYGSMSDMHFALSLIVEECLFRNNTVRCENCLSSAGITTNSDLILRKSEFRGGRSKYGAAIVVNEFSLFDSNRVFIDNTSIFVDNIAKFGANIYTRGRVQVIGNYSAAIATLSSQCSKISIVGITLTHLMPGQMVSISLVALDIYGNKLSTPYIPLILSGSNPDIVAVPQDLNTFNIDLYWEDRRLDDKADEDFVLTILFDQVSVTLPLTLVACKNTFVKRNFKCEDQTALISTLSVVGITAIFMALLVSILVLLYYRTKRTSKLLAKRKQAEIEMERCLIDKRMVFDEDESHQSQISIKSSSNIIVATEDIKLIKKIGEGAQGLVYHASWKGIDVAVKTVKIGDDDELDDNSEFEREAALLSSLRHPNILTFYGICVPNRAQKFMVVEYLRGGSLEKLISNCRFGKETLGLKSKINILLGIARGMRYLHGLKPQMIVHRDLKPGNILLDENLSVRVCDFGLSRAVGSNATQATMTCNIGTLLYCPPETFNDNVQEGHLSKEDRLRNATKIDVYSFAVIMWSLFFEESPYGNCNSQKMNYFKDIKKEQDSNAHTLNILSLVLKGIRPFIPFGTHEQMYEWLQEFYFTREQAYSPLVVAQCVERYMNLMKQCWNQMPSLRPSFDSIVVDLYEMETMLQ